MNYPDWGIEQPENEPNPQKPSAFDIAAKLLLPALSLAAFILVQQTGRQTSLMWALLGLTILFVVIGFYPTLRIKIRARSERAENERKAKDAIPQFRNFVRRFGEFVSTLRSDTLHSLLGEAGRAPGQSAPVPTIPEIGLWYDFWFHFAQRIERQRLGLVDFQFALSEFYSLVGLYDTMCVIRIFNDSRPEFRAGLTDTTKSDLNSFQQRFMAFLIAYENFLKELVESRPAFQKLPRDFSHPKPL